MCGHVAEHALHWQTFMAKRREMAPHECALALSGTGFTFIADGDLDKARVNLEGWFDASMDRVSGWYKRTTQLWLFVIGMVIAVAMNVNIFSVTESLWRDKELRQAIVTQAEAVAAEGEGFQQ